MQNHVMQTYTSLNNIAPLPIHDGCPISIEETADLAHISTEKIYS